MKIKCAHCKDYHESVAQVLLCSRGKLTPPTPEEKHLSGDCECQPSGARCSWYSWKYQSKWGRAENE